MSFFTGFTPKVMRKVIDRSITVTSTTAFVSQIFKTNTDYINMTLFCSAVGATSVSTDVMILGGTSITQFEAFVYQFGTTTSQSLASSTSPGKAFTWAFGNDGKSFSGDTINWSYATLTANTTTAIQSLYPLFTAGFVSNENGNIPATRKVATMFLPYFAVVFGVSSSTVSGRLIVSN